MIGLGTFWCSSLLQNLCYDYAAKKLGLLKLSLNNMLVKILVIALDLWMHYKLVVTYAAAITATTHIYGFRSSNNIFTSLVITKLTAHCIFFNMWSYSELPGISEQTGLVSANLFFVIGSLAVMIWVVFQTLHVLSRSFIVAFSEMVVMNIQCIILGHVLSTCCYIKVPFFAFFYYIKHRNLNHWSQVVWLLCRLL